MFASVLLAAVVAAAPTPAKPESPDAPERTGNVRVEVVPDHEGWTYGLGDPVRFQVRVLRDGQPLPSARVHYEVGLEMLPPTHAGDLEVPPEGLALTAEGLQEPGFLRCVVETSVGGRTYRGLATAGFAPHDIAPAAEDPKDFDAFWAEGKQELAAIPLVPIAKPAPELAVPGTSCFKVSVQNVSGQPRSSRPNAPPPKPSRLYGVLCEPDGPGPFPALLNVPGAGVRGYRGLAGLSAKRQIITLQIGIHGIPIDEEDELYTALEAGALGGYQATNMDDPRRYYYRRVYLGTVRANDLLTQQPKWDRHHLYVTGGSQGGALSIVNAALDPRVRGLAAFYPALSDLTGHLKGRTGGWPFMFRSEAARTPDKLATAGYYDVVNFARRLKVPGFYSWGYNDETCPPTSTFAAYNVIRAPKKLALALETGHFTTPEQNDAAEEFLESLWRPKARPSAPAKKPAPTGGQSVAAQQPAGVQPAAAR
jgi:cephalosporin-C deacetylase-like acetyl esterase